MNNKIRLTRIPIELRRLEESQNDHGMSCTSSSDDLSNLEAIVPGPPNSPYEGTKFHINIAMGDHYPFCPPAFKFQTPIFHPNIDSNGNICLDLLRMPPNGTYNPTITLESILLSIRLLLSCPNPEDPLQCDAAEMYKNNRELFEKTARNFLLKKNAADKAVNKFEDDVISSSSVEVVSDNKSISIKPESMDLDKPLNKENDVEVLPQKLRKISKKIEPAQQCEVEGVDSGSKRSKRAKTIKNYKISKQ